eukprot:TRINITY_DN1875_c5_g1_i1.p1 TRINITY_DN1875_c5_g1~~TRINITY_DN1875_c5_g1_i1.p1  ORF type:complete len:571 (+),score=88.17 TRINITY_DN1875_c5_g1_i1:46-1758(+)
MPLHVESESDDSIVSADGFEVEEEESCQRDLNISTDDIIVPREAVPVPVPLPTSREFMSLGEDVLSENRCGCATPGYEEMAESEISRLQGELHSAYTEVLELTHRLRDLEEENESLGKRYRNAQVAVGAETEKWQRERFELLQKVNQLDEENTSKSRQLQHHIETYRRKAPTRDAGIQTRSETWIPQQHVQPKGVSTQTEECVCVIDHKGVQTTILKSSSSGSQTNVDWDEEINDLQSNLSHVEAQLATHVNSSLAMKQKLVDLHGDSAQLIYIQDNIRELATLFGREQDDYNTILEDMKAASMEYKSYKPFIDDSRAFYSDFFDELETELRLADHNSADDTASIASNSDADTDWGHCKKMLMSLLSSHSTLRLEKRVKPVILPSGSFNRQIASAQSSITRSIKRLTLFKLAFNKSKNNSLGYSSVDSNDVEQILRFLHDAQKMLNDICYDMPGDERRSVGACSPVLSPQHSSRSVNSVSIRSKSHTRYPLRDLSSNRGLSPVSTRSSNSGTPTLQNFKPLCARPVPPPSFLEPSQLHLQQHGKSLSASDAKLNGISYKSSNLTASIWCD